ncbi:Inter alpha-trypsin inhibitor, heavy chain 4 [Bulinus truncatus]|nr:Inter alpha-trypsin inhibitor, heavy chain 4 [Bulinus truncatus]
MQISIHRLLRWHKVIESFHVKSDIRYRFATTQMVSVVRNIEEKAQEITFDVALPGVPFNVNFSIWLFPFSKTRMGLTDYFKSAKCFVAVWVICYTFMFVLGEKEKTVIESFQVRSDIRYRFATTQMVSVVRNKEEKAQEITFDVALPEEAFIVSFSMTIDGKNYDGEVKEKMKATEEYQSAVSKGQSAGLIHQAPRHTNTFAVSVNIAAGSSVNFTLIYQELLRRKNGMYENEIHIKPGQAVEDFLIEIFIQDKARLKFVRTPALRSDSLLSNTIEADNELTVVDLPTPQTAHIVYKPNQEQQGKTGISAKFVVQYDIEHSSPGEIMVVDGYFIHFFAPDLPPLPKDIIFVLDVSGSMDGTKLQQLKSSMKVILNDLQPIDRFNIIIFSSEVRKWKSGVVSVENGTVLEAHRFVDTLIADGLTNINDALLTAIDDLNIIKRKDSVGMIFFLTDGQPTTQEINGRVIADNVQKRNEAKLAIFGLAFGKGADYDLLKKISIQNSGIARKIYEASDAALQVTGLYKEISAVSLKDASISYLPSSINNYTITENKFPIIFNGTEVVVSGKLAAGHEKFEMVIQGIQKSGEVNIILNSDDYSNFILTDFKNPFFTLPKDYSGIVEKMWAYLTIKQLLKEKDRHSTDEAKLKDIDSKILEMSLKYKFVTPLTAMIVKKPDEEKPSVSTLDASDLNDIPPRMAAMKNSYRRPQKMISSLPTLDNAAGIQRSQRISHSFPSLDYTDYLMRRKLYQPTYDPNNGPITRRPIRITSKKTNVYLHKVNKNSAGKGTFTDNPLPVFTVIFGNTSHCFVPKRLKIGTYRLLTLPTGSFINLGFICNKKTSAGWNFSVSPSFSIDDKGDVLTISGEGLIINLTWKSKSYNLEIYLNPSQNYTGLVGDLLKTRATQKKKSKKSVPAVCKNSQLSNAIKNNKANKYLINP